MSDEARNTRQAAARKSVNANEEAKNRQYLHLSLIAGLAVCLVIGFTYFSGVGSIADLTDKPRLVVPGEGVDMSELWRQSAEQDIRVLEESERRLRTSLTTMEERLEVVLDEIGQARIAEQEAAFEREVLRIATMEPPTAQSSQLPEPSAAPPVEEPPQPPMISLVKVGVGTPSTLVEVEQGQAQQQALQQVQQQTQQVSDSQPARERTKDYVPGGSFMKAVILGGIDAPTGNVSRDNPHPVLLRVSDVARLPNLYRKDLRECLVLAAGYGDISSERALMRTERMSCRRQDGGYFDSPVRGFIVGEDGRAGVRGNLVTKQGQLLQRSLLAGIGSGLSEVFRTSYAERLRASSAAIASGSTVTVSPPSADFSDYATAGIASGAGTALGRLADYYIALAERTHPIIEVGAGRTVDIVLQEGINLSMEGGDQQ